MEKITVFECLLYHIQGMSAVINDGRLVRIEQESGEGVLKEGE